MEFLDMDQVKKFYYSFAWKDAPLRTIEYPIMAVSCYLVVIFLLSKFVPKKSKTNTQTPRLMDFVVAVHNYILHFWSLIMCAGCCIELYKRFETEQSMDFYFCEHATTRAEGPLFFWSYIYYISKYYELFDTVLTLAKGSTIPFPFLHIFHHSVVVFMAWLWLEQRQTLQFGGLIFNTFVHVIMYLYYVMKVLKLPTPFKRWITRLQVFQFVFSLICFAITMTYVMDDKYNCSGITGLYFNLAFNSILLFQFIQVLMSGKPKKKEIKKE